MFTFEKWGERGSIWEDHEEREELSENAGDVTGVTTEGLECAEVRGTGGRWSARWLEKSHGL